MDKKIIQFNESYYNQQLFKYNSYVDAIHEAISMIKTETGVELSTEQIKEGRAFEKLQSMFAEKHKIGNTLNLSAVKLMELMEVDTLKIITTLDRLKLHSVKAEPTKEQYTIFAETPQEIERLEVCQQLCDFLKKLGIKNPIDLRNPYQLIHQEGEFKPSATWIKSI